VLSGHLLPGAEAMQKRTLKEFIHRFAGQPISMFQKLFCAIIANDAACPTVYIML
jgi:hypothetical protein